MPGTKHFVVVPLGLTAVQSAFVTCIVNATVTIYPIIIICILLSFWLQDFHPINPPRPHSAGACCHRTLYLGSWCLFWNRMAQQLILWWKSPDLPAFIIFLFLTQTQRTPQKGLAYVHRGHSLAAACTCGPKSTSPYYWNDNCNVLCIKLYFFDFFIFFLSLHFSHKLQSHLKQSLIASVCSVLPTLYSGKWW